MAPGPAGQRVVQSGAEESIETSFAEVVGLIEQARRRAYQAVNTELVGLYWQIGQYISGKLAAAVWGDGVVDRLAQHLARTMLANAASPAETCFACGNFSRCTTATRK